MDALDLLEQQHHELGQLFAHIADAETAGRRTALVAQLVRGIEAHSRVEETVFYAAFAARVVSDEARLWEAFEAQALLRFAAHTLVGTRVTDVRFAARLKSLQHLFQRTAHLEEDWMFPKAKRALQDEVLDRIGCDIERAHAARISIAPPAHERTYARRRVLGDPRRRPAAPSMM